MRPRYLVRLIGVCATWAALTVTSAGQTSAVERSIMQAIDRINAAFQQRDAKTYERLTTADFIRVNSNGRVFGRSDWLKNVVAAGEERNTAAFDELSMRVYGDAAVVTYRNKPTGPGGKPGPVGYLTRVMVKQGNEWIMALAQSTDIQPPTAPTGPAPSPLPAWSALTTTERQALAAFQAIQKANGDRDVPAWELLSAPDHLIIGFDGARTSRAQRVAALKAPPSANTAPPPPAQNLRLVIKGDLAAVTWTAGNARQLKILARKGDQWQQLLQQATPIVAARK